MSMQRFATAATAAALLLAGCTSAADPITTTTTEPAVTTTTTLAVTTTTSSPTTTSTSTPAGDDFEVGRKALLAVADSEGADVPTATAPFAPTVMLGVHNVLSTERSAEDLANASGWLIPVSEYAGFSGPFNPLEALRSASALTIAEGEHPHCAGPPLDPPEGLESATRVHAQPKDIDSCIAWFSVDLWIVEGEIEAVTFELFGP